MLLYNQSPPLMDIYNGDNAGLRHTGFTLNQRSPRGYACEPVTGQDLRWRNVYIQGDSMNAILFRSLDSE